jgi:hypothetical protein
MIGRCGRKLPIDGMLPRVVYSARFTPEADRPRPGARKTQLALCRLNCGPAAPSLPVLRCRRTTSHARLPTPCPDLP